MIHMLFRRCVADPVPSSTPRYRQRILVCSAAVGLALSSQGIAAESDAHAKDQEMARWQAMDERYTAKIRRLDERIMKRAGPSVDLDGIRSEVDQLRSARDRELADLNVAEARVVALRFPWSIASLIAEISFVLLVINALAYVKWAPRPVFQGAWLYWAGGAIIVLFLLPRITWGATVDDDLKTLDKLLSAAPAERALFWLDRLEGEGVTPRLRLKDDLLQPPARVEKRGVSFHFAKASFLWELGRRDETFRALDDMVHVDVPGDYDALYERAVRFLARERADLLKGIGASMLGRMRDRAALMGLAVTLRSADHVEAAEQATQRVIQLSPTVGDILEVVRITFQGKDVIDGEKLLTVGVLKIRGANDANTLVKVALENGVDAVLIPAVDKLAQPPIDRLLDDPDASPELVANVRRALSLGVSRAEVNRIVFGDRTQPPDVEQFVGLAALMFEAGKAGPGDHALTVGTERSQHLSEIRTIVDASLKHERFDVAIHALERGVVLEGPEVAGALFADPLLEGGQVNPPGYPYVSLAVLLASLNDRAEIASGASPAYDRGAQLDIKVLLDAAAFSFPANVRSLYYVQRHWRRDGEYQRLALLRGAYRRMLIDDVRSFAAARMANARDYRKLTGERASLVASRSMLSDALKALRAARLRASVAEVAWWLRDVSAVVALIIVLVGVSRHASDYAVRVTRFRAYTFFWRFNEGLGWVSVFSVVGAVAGILQVVVAQLFLVAKSIDEVGTPVSRSDGSGRS